MGWSDKDYHDVLQLPENLMHNAELHDSAIDEGDNV
jgi:hypothetical protein